MRQTFPENGVDMGASYPRYYDGQHDTGGTRVIEFAGKEVEIHDTGNFQAIVEAYVDLKDGKSADPIEQPGRWAYQQRLMRGNGPMIVQLLDYFALSAPDQFAVMRHLAKLRAKKSFLNQREAAALYLINSRAADSLGDILLANPLPVTLAEICS